MIPADGAGGSVGDASRDSSTGPDAERSAKLRAFFARYVTERGGARDDPRIERAFATVPREPFAGPPPWSIAGPLTFYPATGRYFRTPDGDPAFLYQDVLVALDPARGINIGEPGFHAFCLASLALREGETVTHVGAGSGYYSAVLAELVGARGRVDAFEIDPALAARARRNLAGWPQAVVHERSGALGDLPSVDAIYVNAACVEPSKTWLRALVPGGRLLFPLQTAGALGGMLSVQRPPNAFPAWPARFITRAIFVECQGLQQDEAGRRLKRSFDGGMDWQAVRSLRFDEPRAQGCWFRGDGWWLSTHDPDLSELDSNAGRQPGAAG